MNAHSDPHSVVIVGLPSSGKTTFLAALWHLITEQREGLVLRFGDLAVGDLTHLNAIARRWRSAQVQDRTGRGSQTVVKMNLLDQANQQIEVTFPDSPGEGYRQMWTERECDPAIAEVLPARGVLLVVHGDQIRPPMWVTDMVQQSAQIGVEYDPGDIQEWDAGQSPTQVQLVSVLESLREPPLDIGAPQLAILISAWDKVRDEGLTPDQFLTAKLPLLDQYLRSGADAWTWRTYGVSAQGGDYDQVQTENPSADAERLRALDVPSERIELVQGNDQSRDLTEPIAWLIASSGGAS